MDSFKEFTSLRRWVRQEFDLLHERIDNLRKDWNKKIEAIHSASYGSNCKQGKKPIEPLAIKFTDKYVLDQNKSQKEQTAIQRSIKNWTRFAAVAAVIYGAVAALQWNEMKRLNKFNNDSLKILQRAFISCNKVNEEWSVERFRPGKDIGEFVFYMPCQNSGATAATVIGQDFAIDIGPDVQENAPFKGDGTKRSYGIGPKESVDIGNVAKTDEELGLHLTVDESSFLPRTWICA